MVFYSGSYLFRVPPRNILTNSFVMLWARNEIHFFFVQIQDSNTKFCTCHQLAHRAYMNLKTIRPNMVLLGQLFSNRSVEWPEFQKAVLDGHKNRQGQIKLRKEKQSIYTYPAPDCMCQD